MPTESELEKNLPLLREFGDLERKRQGDGVTPLEYQRWLDLKHRVGDSLAEGVGPTSPGVRGTRLRIIFKTRAKLLDALVDNIMPAGLYVSTPFAAEVGTELILRIVLEAESLEADVPATVVTSLCAGSKTLSTMSMGMSLKLGKPTRSQRRAASQLFDGLLDSKLRIWV